MKLNDLKNAVASAQLDGALEVFELLDGEVYLIGDEEAVRAFDESTEEYTVDWDDDMYFSDDHLGGGQTGWRVS
jgi:hypothetical protein